MGSADHLPKALVLERRERGAAIGQDEVNRVWLINSRPTPVLFLRYSLNQGVKPWLDLIKISALSRLTSFCRSINNYTVAKHQSSGYITLHIAQVLFSGQKTEAQIKKLVSIQGNMSEKLIQIWNIKYDCSNEQPPCIGRGVSKEQLELSSRHLPLDWEQRE